MLAEAVDVAGTLRKISFSSVRPSSDKVERLISA
jgi:hypothetical protein